MAKLTNFDAEQIQQPNTSARQVLPAGYYLCQIVRSECKPNKKGTGSYLELEMAVIDNAYSATLYTSYPLIERLNLDHPDERTVEISRQKLAKICLSVGVPRPQDTEELHGLSFGVRVGVKKVEFWGVPRDENVIVDYMTADEWGAQMVSGTPLSPPPTSEEVKKARAYNAAHAKAAAAPPAASPESHAKAAKALKALREKQAASQN